MGSKQTNPIYVFVFLISLLVSNCAIRPKRLPDVSNLDTKYRPIWVKDLEAVRTHGTGLPLGSRRYNSGNLPIGFQGPASAGDVVYVASSFGDIYAINHRDGKILWTYPSEQAAPSHAPIAVVGDDIVTGNNRGRVFVIDRFRGLLRYSADLGASIESTPIFFQIQDVKYLVVHLRDHRLVCLEASTGKIIWSYRRAHAEKATLQRASTPLYFDGKLYTGHADGHLSAIDALSGRVIWEQNLADNTSFSDIDSTPFWYDNKLFVGPYNSNLKVIDPTTGSILLVHPFIASRAPLLFQDELIFPTVGGELIAYFRGQNQTKRSKLSDYPITGIQLAGDDIVVTSADGIVRFINKTTWQLQGALDLGAFGSAVYAPMTAPSGKDLLYFVQSARNRLYAFRSDL